MNIHSKGGLVLAEAYDYSYSGTFMGERFVSCSVKSENHIDFLPGDYLTFRGESFVLDYTPTAKKTSSAGSTGDAFQYDLKFVSLNHELEKCMFLDVVLNDNEIHYTGISDVQVFGNALVLAHRILANLNRLYKGEHQWSIEVLKETDAQNISLSDSNCWDALSQMKTLFNLNFTVAGRKITVGSVGRLVDHVFKYGSGNGLKDITRTTVDGEAIATRLRAYGGERNLPRDYNKTGLVPESQYIKSLMLPGYTETLIDYIDSENIPIYGIREAVFKDEEIYPSIYGVTADDLTEAGVVTSATGRIDEIVAMRKIEDDKQSTFEVWIKDIGFNINDYLTPTTALLSMRDGNLGGYDFEITKCVMDTISYTGAKYKLTLNRNDNDNFVLPDRLTEIKGGDHFVLLEIYMPDIYVKTKEQRLLTKAREYLSEYDHTKATYSITMDKVFMAYNPAIGDDIREGDLIHIMDEDLKLDRNIIIQNLNIKTGGIVPEYDITLSDNPVPTTLDRVQDNISDIEHNITNSDGKNETLARNNAIALNRTKDRIFDTDGNINGKNIAPNSIETNALSVGAKSRNFVLNCNIKINHNGNANLALFSAGKLIHREIKHSVGEETLDYTWSISEKQITLTDPNVAYYMYAKCSITSGIAEWYLSIDMLRYDEDTEGGYYYFLVGDIYEVVDGVRGENFYYGKTWINGRFLTTGLIQSPRGLDGSYWDLDNDKLSVGGLTTIENGLVLTKEFIITDAENRVFAGLSGHAIEDTDIVFWTGGEKRENASKSRDIGTPASVVFRKDGSGYLASNNLQWDKYGNLTSKFRNLFIGDDDVTTFINKFNRMFSLDEEKDSIFTNYNMVSYKGVSAYGVGPGGGGGGGWDLIDNLLSNRVDAGLTANQGRILKGLIDGKASDWNSITGKPTEFNPAPHTHTDYALTNHTHTTYSLTTHTHLEYFQNESWNKYFYEQDGKLFCKLDFVSEKGISSYGVGTGGGGGTGVDIIDNLLSTRVDSALSANQGRILKSLIDGKASDWNSITGKPSVFATNWANVADKPNFDATYLKLTGGTITGDFGLFASKVINFRSEDTPYKSGIGVDKYGNECQCFWNAQAVSRFRFHSGINLSAGIPAGSMMGITPDFEIKKEGIFISGKEGWHAGNLNLPTVDFSAKDVTANGYLQSIHNGKIITIGSQSSSYCHYETTATHGHWFNSTVFAAGDIFGGTNYNRRLAYVDEIAGIRVNLAASLVGFETSDISSPRDANNCVLNGLYYVTSNFPAWMNISEGALFAQAYNSTWVAQIAQDYRNGDLGVRGKNAGTWTPWQKVWHSGNSNKTNTPWNCSRLNVGDGCSIGLNDVYLSLNSGGNEICITGGSDIHVNYRAGSGTVPLNWFWRNGISTGWSDHFFGSITANNTIYSYNWFVSYGNTGWFSDTYKGGIWMNDSNAVKIYGNKLLYNDGYRVWGIGGHNVGLKLYDNNHIGINLANNHFTWGIYSNKDGNLYFGRRVGDVNDSSGSYYYVFGAGQLTVLGNIIATGEVTAYSASDIRLKTNLRPLDGLKYLRGLQAYEFAWNDIARNLTGDNRQHGFGYIAQDVHRKFPEFTHNIYNSEYLGVRYEKFLPLYGAAILQLDSKQSEHERRIKALERENSELKQQLNKLTA